MTTLAVLVFAALGGYLIGRVGASNAVGWAAGAGAVVAGYLETILGWFGG